jgi:hypothetical protein
MANKTRRRGGSRKRVPVFKSITMSISPDKVRGKIKERLPVFKLLTKSRKSIPGILDAASKLGLNSKALSFSPTKGRGKGKHRRKGSRKNN